MRCGSLIAIALLVTACGRELVARTPPAPSSAAAPADRGRSTAADKARSQFSNAFYCPESRVEVTPTDAIEPAPPEIAADPERADVWRRNHAADGRERFDLRGCGQSLRLACSVASSVFCLPVQTLQAPRAILNPETTEASLDSLLQKAMQAHRGGHARLGIAYSPTLANGLLVRAVLSGGPSDGKLLPGDVIVGAGDDLGDDKVALDLVVQAHVGRPLALSVMRAGARRTISVDVPSP